MVQSILSLIIAILDILMHFRCNLWRNTLFYLFLHSLSIPVREFRSVQAWRSSRKLINARVHGAVRALVWRFKRKRTWRLWHHDLESIRHDLESLCSDNDLRCHMRKIKMISSDWITLLRRLLILDKTLFACFDQGLQHCLNFKATFEFFRQFA